MELQSMINNPDTFFILCLKKFAASPDSVSASLRALGLSARRVSLHSK